MHVKRREREGEESKIETEARGNTHTHTSIQTCCTEKRHLLEEEKRSYQSSQIGGLDSSP